MRYTTVTKVRQSSGFRNNSNVTDTFIAGMITEAQGMIDSQISDAYALPLPKYYENAVAFTGTGTGSSSMTITINGTDYAVAVTSGMTAAQAADAFRSAAIDGGDFVTDGHGDGATVTIWSKTEGDIALVTISSADPQTVAGIAAAGGTVTTVPAPYIAFLARELVTARMLIVEYGEDAQDTDKDGFKRLAMWEDELEKISKKKKKLYDYAGNQLTRASRNRLKFRPNDLTEADTDNSTNSRFTMNKVY